MNDEELEEELRYAEVARKDFEREIYAQEDKEDKLEFKCITCAHLITKEIEGIKYPYCPVWEAIKNYPSMNSCMYSKHVKRDKNYNVIEECGRDM